MGNLSSIILECCLVGDNERKTPRFGISKANLVRTDSCESDEYTLFDVSLNDVEYLTHEIDIR
jgi:hypothetical protein